MNKAFDIVIVGGGMVGASLAASLAETNYSVLLLEASEKNSFLLPLSDANAVSGFESRVSALTLKTQRFLSEIGVWDSVQQDRVCFYDRMEVWDEDGTGRIIFDAAEMHHEQLGCIVENQQLVLALHHELEAAGNVEIRYGSVLKNYRLLKNDDAESADVQIELVTGEQINAGLLVGADGVNSKVRGLSGLPTREWDYGHHAIVATVQTELPHTNCARQRFSESGPIAFLPLLDRDASEKFCSIVWSIESDQAEALMALDDETFKEKLGAQIENALGRIIEISPRFSFPLRQRHAKDYVDQGLALVGDAAHSIHPLAGQGVNLGFQDVIVLRDQLLAAQNDKLSPSHPFLLKRYQRMRKGDNLVMMGVMEGFKQLFGNTEPELRWLRNTGLNFFNKQSFLKNKVAAKAMGLDS